MKNFNLQLSDDELEELKKLLNAKIIKTNSYKKVGNIKKCISCMEILKQLEEQEELLEGGNNV